MTGLSEILAEKGVDAYVAYDTSENADMRYLAGFLASDPYVYVFPKDKRESIIVSAMEELRARRESACSVVTRSEAGLPEILKEFPNPLEATAHMIKNFAGKKLLVPSSMQVGFYLELAKIAEVTVDSGTVARMREVKSHAEIELIREVQKRNEEGLSAAIDLIKRSEPDAEGRLWADGEAVTSERAREEIAKVLWGYSCEEKDTIVSCGQDTALPHAKGTGSLYANQPIVLDVFPRNITNGYFADMTRTVSKGEPSIEIQEMYAAVHAAKELAIEMIGPGVLGAAVHSAVVEFFKAEGYETAGSSGFIHSLGHGVGLEIHEGPSLSVSGGVLAEGNVVTVEPGLYYPGIGGVRLEDMGVVTQDGFDRFTNFEEKLVV